MLTTSGNAHEIRSLCVSLAQAQPSTRIVVAGPRVPPEAWHEVIALTFDETCDPTLLGDLDYRGVLLHEFATTELIASPLLRHIFSRAIRSIRHVNRDGARWPYRPYAGRAAASRVLFVFPGAPIPLDKGSNQRAFGLVSYLNRSGIATDVLLTTGPRGDKPWLRDVLTTIAPTVHTYRNNKPFLRLRAQARRTLERAYRLARGVRSKPSDLFVERLHTRAAGDGVTQLARLVSSGQYDAVIVSFAWMSGLVTAARKAAPPATTWICDTHDVQFVRGATQNEHEIRLGVSQAAEQSAELTALSKYDAVLAISPADCDELRRHLVPSRVILTPSGFDYAYQPIGRPDGGADLPTRFGFIGRSMEPNAKALQLLLDRWWPRIRQVVPGARLLVAGTICARRDMRDLAARAPGVELLGFVPSLASYYQQLDIALNPVVVQGGLNFKSLEALAAGRLLITTPMGAKCLGADAPVIVAEAGAAVADAVRSLTQDPAAYMAQRKRAQAWCMDTFGEQRAYGPLQGLLSV